MRANSRDRFQGTVQPEGTQSSVNQSNTTQSFTPANRTVVSGTESEQPSSMMTITVGGQGINNATQQADADQNNINRGGNRESPNSHNSSLGSGNGQDHHLLDSNSYANGEDGPQQRKLTWALIPEPNTTQAQGVIANGIESGQSTMGPAATSGMSSGIDMINNQIRANAPGQIQRYGMGSFGNAAAGTTGATSTANQGVSCTPQIKNHTATLYKKKLYVFGGYDGKKNHSSLRVFDTERNMWVKQKKTSGPQPMGRNGHTATLVKNKLYIIGGWLGQGPLAADDLHILDLDLFRWLPHQTSGESPGPCNMHTADAFKDNIYVFRGGDGRDYLNDLHELNTSVMQWIRVEADGSPPPPRANHSSSIIGCHLFIFGGWDGAKRLNDLFTINLESRMWTQVVVKGESPAPRAGMSLCTVGSKLYLFGGSGPHAQCFNDLYTFNPKTSGWTHCNFFTDNNQKPKMRAGHSMTYVGTSLYIIGGSYGQDYLKDVYQLDTDPCPEWNWKLNTSNKFASLIADQANNPEFSDIVFMVEGKPYYAHKVIICQLSEKFRTMMRSGLAESSSDMTGGKTTVNITNVPYNVFYQIMHYLYTGKFEALNHIGQSQSELQYNNAAGQNQNGAGQGNEIKELSQEEAQAQLDQVIEYLRVADEEFLDDIKMICEEKLKKLCNMQSFHLVCEAADLYNANRLKEYCAWFQRIHILPNKGKNDEIEVGDSEMSQLGNYSFLNQSSADVVMSGPDNANAEKDFKNQ